MSRLNVIKEKYINLMLEISKIEDEDKLNQEFIKTYTKYSKFCCRHKLNNYSEELFKAYSDKYLFPCIPIMHQIDNEKLNQIIDKLEKILSNQIIDGLTIEEASYLLKSVVNSIREELQKKHNLEIASLRGACGFAQAISYYLLDSLGIKTTINNARNFPDSKNSHAFLTCFLPIKEENQIVYEQFLVDTTYRQFFLTIDCNEGKFYTYDKRFKNDASPNPGYYINKSEYSKKIAEELLENGFLELSENNALVYGSGFSYSSITLQTRRKDISRILSYRGNDYINNINDKSLQVEVDYTKEEMEDYGVNINLKTIGDKNNKNK